MSKECIVKDIFFYILTLEGDKIILEKVKNSSDMLLFLLIVYCKFVWFFHVNLYNINAINAAATIAGPNGK